MTAITSSQTNSELPSTEAAGVIVAGPVVIMVGPWTADIPATTIAATAIIASKINGIAVSFILY
jgi:uncharacterized membrane protein